MKIDVRPAELSDVHSVAAILTEAAQWLESSGIGMWRAEEVSAGRIERDVADGLFHLAHADQPLGTIKFQLSDVEFWPEFAEGQAAFVHRLAVRRECAGSGISTALLEWAVRRAQTLGRQFLRLDCEAFRRRLRAVYERFGFRHHSNRHVGPYCVARYEVDVRKLLS